MQIIMANPISTESETLGGDQMLAKDWSRAGVRLARSPKEDGI